MKKSLLFIESFLLLTVLVTVQPVVAEETIYIGSDGSIDPPTAPILREGDIYTFTGNIQSGLLVERSDIVIDGAGHLLEGDGKINGSILNNVSNVTIKNLKIKNFSHGVILKSSLYCLISANNILENAYDGIKLINSRYNTISENNITSNKDDGIQLWLHSNYNTISKNNITANIRDGVSLRVCSNNTISGNNIKNNGCGITPFASSNSIYHNDFVDNCIPVDNTMAPAYLNFWDNGYPSGGNFWTDYAGMDANYDGIGDAPYHVVYDRYPLMKPHYAHASDLVIIITSPKNETYVVASIVLNFSVNEATSRTVYCLDDYDNITLYNTCMDIVGLSEGAHSIVVYATDRFRLNTVASDTIYFQIQSISEPDHSDFTDIGPVITVVIVLMVAFSALFTKIKKHLKN